jgi:GNAT superfamily N-acetyltransferase
MLTIRDARPGDGSLLLRLIRALADYERLAHEVVATPSALEQALFAEPPRAHALIGEWEGTAAAFALYFFNFSTFLARPGLHLEDLFVLPELRGRGIGKALLVELARRAQREQCGRMEWAVLEWNAPAIRFYESLGAKRLEDWRTFRLTAPTIGVLSGSAEGKEESR